MYVYIYIYMYVCHASAHYCFDRTIFMAIFSWHVFGHILRSSDESYKYIKRYLRVYPKQPTLSVS